MGPYRLRGFWVQRFVLQLSGVQSSCRGERGERGEERGGGGGAPGGFRVQG